MNNVYWAGFLGGWSSATIFWVGLILYGKLRKGTQ